MASTKLISSSARNSDRRKSSAASSSSSSTMPPYPHDLQQYNNNNNTSIINNNLEATSRIFHNNNNNNIINSNSSSTLLNAEITLLDAAGAITPITDTEMVPVPVRKKTVDDVWREIVEGKKEQRKVCKTEAPDEIMTLEDFLVKAGAVEEEAVAGGVVEQGPVKVELGTERLSGGIFGFDSGNMYMAATPQQSVEGFGNGRGKRKAVLEPLDKAAMQRQRRMIKNRESAARSRERKQAYQVELESMAVKLEEENEQLLKEKDERIRAHYKQLIEKVIPVVEKRRPPPTLRRVRSMQW